MVLKCVSDLKISKTFFVNCVQTYSKLLSKSKLYESEKDVFDASKRNEDVEFVK